MALVVKDRVKETTATTGTGTLTLGSAVAGFQAFSAVLSNADTTYYAIFESSTGAFEVGLGTYASPANTLARTTVLESSNAGSAINLTAGDADVFVTQPAEKAVYLDADGYIFVSDGRNLTNLNATNLTTGTVNDARLPATISSDITGNAATATAWATGRTLALTGDVTGTSAAFDGSGNITLSTTIAANSVALGTDTTGNYVAAGAVSGSGLSGSASSEGATFTVTSNATNANTPSTIVFRDGSGNFSAGTITANLSGNATTATTATTANGVAANSVALGTDTTGNYVATIATNAGLDGSGSSEGAAVTLSLNLSELTTSTSDADGDFFVVVDTANAQKKLTKGNINISGFNNDAGYTTNVGDITGVTAGSFITGGGTSGTVTINVDATSANTASKVVARDGSGNFSAGTITAALTGNASTASALQTARNIALTGAVTGNANFDGSGNISITTTATSDPTLTLAGDATGSATFTNLGSATLTVTVVDDSHNHIISNVDGLQTALDGKLSTSGKAADSNLLDGIDSGSFLRSDADDAFTGNLTTGADNHVTFGPNSSWSSYLRVGGNGRTVSGASSASVVTTNGNLHLDSGSDKATYLNFYAGTAGTFFGSGSEHIVAVMGSDGDLWKGSADNTGYKYWHAGNDGSGSGLDADLLDGQHASSFASTGKAIAMAIVFG